MVGFAVAILFTPLVLWCLTGLGLLYAIRRFAAEALLRLAAVFVALWSLLATTVLVWVIAHGGFGAIPALLSAPELLFVPSAAGLWLVGAVGVFVLFFVAFLLNQAVGRGFLLLYPVEDLPWPAGLARPAGRTTLGRVHLGRPAAFSFTLVERQSRRALLPRRREVILVSEELLVKLTDEELRAVVAHELAHVRRLDSRYLTFLRTLSRLFRWDPIFATVASSLTRCEEFRADAIALELTGNPGALARALGHTLRSAPRTDSNRSFVRGRRSTPTAAERELGERIRRLETLESIARSGAAPWHA